MVAKITRVIVSLPAQCRNNTVWAVNIRPDNQPPVLPLFLRKRTFASGFGMYCDPVRDKLWRPRAPLVFRVARSSVVISKTPVWKLSRHCRECALYWGSLSHYFILPRPSVAENDRGLFMATESITSQHHRASVILRR